MIFTLYRESLNKSIIKPKITSDVEVFGTLTDIKWKQLDIFNIAIDPI